MPNRHLPFLTIHFRIITATEPVILEDVRGTNTEVLRVLILHGLDRAYRAHRRMSK